MKNKEGEQNSMNKAIADLLNDNMREYAKAVVSERAIPSIVDGLKPTARRSLYTSHKFYGGKRTKVNELAGRAVKFVPTGDAGTIGAVSNMARQWAGANNFALFKPIGAVGSRVFDGQDSIAAPRYLSVEMSAFAREFLLTDSEIWNYIPNYDESDFEIAHFYPIAPVFLINGVEGIAFGVATKIYPRKPSEIARVIKAILDGKKLIKEPDPWFAHFQGEITQHMPKKWETTGAAKKLSSTEYHVFELPIGMSREKYIKKLENMKGKGKIISYDDNCTDQFDFRVKTKRNAFKDEHDFMMGTAGATTLSENIYVLDEDKKLMHFTSIVDLLREFVKIKLRNMETLQKYHISVENFEIGLLSAKIKAIENKLLENKFKSRKTMLEYIIKKMGIKEQYAVEVVEMRAHHFTDEYLKKLKEQLGQHEVVLRHWKDTKPDRLVYEKVERFREMIHGF